MLDSVLGLRHTFPMSLLAFNQVRFAYRGAPTPALDTITLDVQPGEFVGIAGATGAGKSTLVRAASGIVPKFFRGCFEGHVSFRGESIARKRVADLAGKVGTVFQDFESQLFSTNVRIECAFGMENLGLDRCAMRDRIARVSRLLGLEALMDREPQTLSGGQKQRLALASVLCMEPDILLCDEPTTDLDPAGRKELFDALETLSKTDHAVVLVEHETERLVHADRIVILGEGRIAAQGKPAQVLADPDFCLKNGIFAPQLFSLAARLGLAERPLSLEDALVALDRGGCKPLSGLRFDDPPGPDAPLIEVRNLQFAYTPRLPVLNGVDLTIGRGDFVAILGQNGSGKTTLVKHLNGLLSPTSGQVLFEDTPVQFIGTARMAGRVGFVFQNPDHMLFADTVFNEVAFGLRNLGVPSDRLAARVMAALGTVGLSGREQTDPFIMTKGDRQKLAVACILACEPEVLILDEPTTGLDAREQAAMMDLLARLNREGHTIIIVTHALDIAAQYARRVILVHEGRIIADGPTRRVFHTPASLAQAGLTPPPCVVLGARLGIPSLTVEELVRALERKSA